MQGYDPAPAVFVGCGCQPVQDLGNLSYACEPMRCVKMLQQLSCGYSTSMCRTRNAASMALPAGSVRLLRCAVSRGFEQDQAVEVPRYAAIVA